MDPSSPIDKPLPPSFGPKTVPYNLQVNQPYPQTKIEKIHDGQS
jgi:hypothetical protein